MPNNWAFFFGYIPKGQLMDYESTPKGAINNI